MSEIWNLSALCRCCHQDGYFKRLDNHYINEGTIEIYSELLQKTFGFYIQPPPLDASYSICDDCIVRLRDSYYFKAQVVDCEEKFKVYCANELALTSSVKVEDPNDSADECGDHHETIEIEVKCELGEAAKVEGSRDNFEIKSPKIEKSGELKNTEIPLIDNQSLENHKKEEAPELIRQRQGRPKKKLEGIVKKKKTKINSKQIGKPTSNDIEKNKIFNNASNLNKGVASKRNNKKNPSHSNDQKVGIKEIHKNVYSTGTSVAKKENDCKFGKQDIADLIETIKRGNETEYRCKLCFKEFSSQYDVHIHMPQFHKQAVPCQYCLKLLRTTIAYRTHIAKHIRYKTDSFNAHHCNFCKKILSDNIKFNRHLASHYRSQTYTCDYCQKQFKSKSVASTHMKWHLGIKKQHMCHLCGMLFTKTNLKSHYDTVHLKLRLFKCHICPKTLSSKKHLNAHVYRHTGEWPFKCNECNIGFPTKYPYDKHRQNHVFKQVKRKDNVLICPVCGDKFEDRRYYLDHVATLHGATIHARKRQKAKYYQCQICLRGFCGKYSLVRHMSSHDPDTEKRLVHKCEVCGKRFAQLSTKTRHYKRAHLKSIQDQIKKPCHLCKKRVLDMSRHLKSHVTRPHGCDHCEKRYPERNALNYHVLKVHMGKRFACEVCAKKYSSLTLLNRHRGVVHKLERMNKDDEGLIVEFIGDVKKESDITEA